MNLGSKLGLVPLCALACGGRSIDAVPLGCEVDVDCPGALVCVLQECRAPEASGGQPTALTGGTGGRSTASGGASNRAGSSSHVGGSGGAVSGPGGAPGGTGSVGVTVVAAGGASAVAGRDGGMSACDSAGESAMFTCLDIDASALVADPARGLLYAVVTGGALEHANELVVIDPVHATIQATVVVGSDPDSLALSDDGTKLWVGLHGAFAIREIDLTRSAPDPGPEYAVPEGMYGGGFGVHAGIMLALPGSPDSVLVALENDHVSPSSAGVLLLDAGNPRPNRLDGRPGITSLTGGPSGYLFGTDDDSELLAIVADANGLTATSHTGVVKGALTQVLYDQGFLFTPGGQVIDVTSPEKPVLTGTFPYTGYVVPHTAHSSAVMLSHVNDPPSAASPARAFNSLILRRLNLATFGEESEVALDGRYFNPGDFVEPSPGVFAFIDYEIPAYGGAPVARTAVMIVPMPDFAE